MMPHRLFSATASTTPLPRAPEGPTSRIWRSLTGVSEVADMTIPFKSKKMRLAYLGVHLQAASLLRHSSAITEWKQATPIAVHRTNNRCSRERRKWKKYRGRKHSKEARAGCVLASRDLRRNAVRRPPNRHHPLERQPWQCPVQIRPPQ